MEQDLFKKQFVGKDGFHWWIGQVAPEDTWKENIPKKAVESNEDIKGFGERYRVRIMGSDPQDKQELSDEELRWAGVMYPVTSGSGSRASSQNANIGQGTFVFGWYLDGEDGQIPIIMGCLGYNEYQAIDKTPNQQKGFIPFSGFKDNEKQPAFAVRDSQYQGLVIQQDESGNPINNYWTESSTLNVQALDFSTVQLWKDDRQPQALAQTEECEPYPTNRIQKAMQDYIQKTEALKKAQYDVRYALTGKIASIQSGIEKLTTDYCALIASLLKTILTQTEKDVLDELNRTLKPFYIELMPNERPDLKEEEEKLENQIVCLFKKLIGNLLDAVCDYLRQNESYNVPPCEVEALAGNVVAQALNQTQNLLNQASNNIAGMLGQSTGIANNISNALQCLTNLYSFLDCEENPDCPKTNEWSILSGSREGMSSSCASILATAQSFANGSNGGFGGNVENFGSLSLNYNDIMNTAGNVCQQQTQPIQCGPPTVVFFGSDGFGAEGNLIISAEGNVIGYDLIDPGSGYDDSVRAYVYDSCGYGSGSDVTPIVEDGGIIDLEINDTGSGYLPAPDGSTGGDGRPIAGPDDTVVDGQPIPPGNVVPVPPGGIVKPPPGTEVPVYPGDQVIPGGTPTVVPDGGFITTPFPEISTYPGTYPGTYPSANAYPVILYLCEINIIETGVGYSRTDELVIEPSNGAKAEFNVDNLGRVISVKVTESGEGFLNMPEIYIRSQTGFNNVLRGKLCVDRIGQDEVKVVPQDKVISVIDCVGKVNGR